ncbi:MAG TPA: outer membrane beta-barrel protein [Acidobacteriaceae bacterium]|nr:outer membrane beta-barrel protein [Acidobacteriaceae bacterium]
MKWISIALLPVLSMFVTPVFAQTSVGLSAYGVFSGTTTGNGTQQSPANQAGGLIELRHIANPILGFEATYSFNRANQTYSSPVGNPPEGVACPSFGCTTSLETVRANAHEITADWVPSLGVANFRPFGVLGVGLLLDVPSESEATVYSSCPACPVGVSGTTITSSPTATSTKAVYVYGAGLDWGLLPHLGLRFQYRGNLYQAPDVSKLFTSSNAFTHTAEPMIGAYFNF